MLYPKIIGFNKLNAFVKIKTKERIINIQCPTFIFQLSVSVSSSHWKLVIPCWLLGIEYWVLDIDNALFTHL
tara:strand:+ start:6693 stop:6908 length:216 start_codon:yes stop_codon:yes gene_type:complete